MTAVAYGPRLVAYRRYDMAKRRLAVGLLAAALTVAGCEVGVTEGGDVEVQPDTDAQVDVGPDGVQVEDGAGGEGEGGEGEGGEGEGGD